MKPFKFSLQAVLILREQEEQTALQQYAQALQAHERASSALHAVQEELASAWAAFHQKLSCPCLAAELSQTQAFCQAVEKKLKEHEYLAHVARSHANRAFLQLLAARQARTLLEKLAAKQKASHQQARRRLEQKALDNLPSRPGLLTPTADAALTNLWN